MPALENLEQETTCGFVVFPKRFGSSVWHADADCFGMATRSQVSVHAPTLGELARREVKQGRFPCRYCAHDVLLDYLSAHPGGPGWHYLTCGADRHDAGCGRCRDLARYANERGVLCATDDNRVKLLRPGTLESSVRSLFGLTLTGHSAHVAGLEAVTAPTWAAVARILDGPATLGEVLEAAAGLHKQPALTTS